MDSMDLVASLALEMITLIAFVILAEMLRKVSMVMEAMYLAAL